MLKIKIFHFAVMLIVVSIIGAAINNSVFLIIFRIVLLTTYSIYVFSIIPQLDNIFKSMTISDYKVYNFSKLLICIAILFRIYSGFVTYRLDSFDIIDFELNNFYNRINNIIIIFILFINIPYLLTKTILSCEQKEIIKVVNYSFEFMKFIFPPIALWIMVPRINKIYENYILENM